MHGVYLGGLPKEHGEGRAEVRQEGEADSKGLVITPVTTMGTGGWISWETSRSHISEISQLRVRELGACTPPPASLW